MAFIEECLHVRGGLYERGVSLYALSLKSTTTVMRNIACSCILLTETSKCMFKCCTRAAVHWGDLQRMLEQVYLVP